ncbi:ABC transporter substrate-binding protein [Gordonia sp. DT30]|uniref:ABC transporter substrate-binding protein n=1 Tax=unclassified Gordonia (in: high G+C Gram-positive bacteria) TaxID=2657482 RepID=UPI003CF80055
MFSLSRRGRLHATLAIVAAALTLVVSACSSSDDEQATGPDGKPLQTLDVSLGWIKNVEFGGFWVADDKGYYADEGLKINWIAGGPNAPTPMQTVASGEAKIGVVPSMQQWLATFAHGDNWEGIGTIFQDSPGVLLSLPGHPVHSAKDMVGQKVLGQDGTQIQYDAVFRIAGLQPNYTFIPVGFDVAPLVDKQGVAYTAYSTNQPRILQHKYNFKPSDYVMTSYSDLGLPTYGDIMFTDKKFAQGNADVLTRFLRASLRGFTDNMADTSVGAKLAVDKYGADLGLDLAQQTEENQDQQVLTKGSYGKPLLWMDPTIIADKMYPGLRAAGVSGLPPAASIVNMSYLEAAQQPAGK